MADQIQPFEGPFTLDFQSLNGVLIDAADGATQGCRREKEDWEKARHELTSRLPLYAADLRVAADLGDQITTLNDRLAAVRALKVQAEQNGEVLKPSRTARSSRRGWRGRGALRCGPLFLQARAR